MTNALVITPALFKQQLIWRICSLLSTRRGQTFSLEDANITAFGDIQLTSIFAKNGRDLYITWIGSEDEISNTTNANEFYIEDIWAIYMACEPIYQQRLVDYANFEG